MYKFFDLIPIWIFYMCKAYPFYVFHFISLLSIVHNTVFNHSLCQRQKELSWDSDCKSLEVSFYLLLFSYRCDSKSFKVLNMIHWRNLQYFLLHCIFDENRTVFSLFKEIITLKKFFMQNLVYFYKKYILNVKGYFNLTYHCMMNIEISLLITKCTYSFYRCLIQSISKFRNQYYFYFSQK